MIQCYIIGYVVKLFMTSSPFRIVRMLQGVCSFMSHNLCLPYLSRSSWWCGLCADIYIYMILIYGSERTYLSNYYTHTQYVKYVHHRYNINTKIAFVQTCVVLNVGNIKCCLPFRKGYPNNTTYQFTRTKFTWKEYQISTHLHTWRFGTLLCTSWT